MPDPIVALGTAAAAPRAAPPLPARAAAAPPAASDAVTAQVRAVRADLERARALGAEAAREASGPSMGVRSDVEGVLLATRKADAAYVLLEAARNAMVEAYARARGTRG